MILLLKTPLNDTKLQSQEKSYEIIKISVSGYLPAWVYTV